MMNPTLDLHRWRMYRNSEQLLLDLVFLRDAKSGDIFSIRQISELARLFPDEDNHHL